MLHQIYQWEIYFRELNNPKQSLYYKNSLRYNEVIPFLSRCLLINKGLLQILNKTDLFQINYLVVGKIVVSFKYLRFCCFVFFCWECLDFKIYHFVLNLMQWSACEYCCLHFTFCFKITNHTIVRNCSWLFWIYT